MRRFLLWVFLALASPVGVAHAQFWVLPPYPPYRPDPLYPAQRAYQDLLDRMEADNEANQEYFAQHPLPPSAMLTLARATVGTLAQSQNYLFGACKYVLPIPSYVDVTEAAKLKPDTMRYFGLIYNEFSVRNIRKYVGAYMPKDRSLCAAVRRNYLAAIKTFTLETSRMKRMGY